MWIATAPFVLAVSLISLESTDFFSPLGPVIIILYFSVALLIDARQVALHSPTWNPNLYFWASASLLDIVTFGVFTFVLAPYYLYRQRYTIHID